MLPTSSAVCQHDEFAFPQAHVIFRVGQELLSLPAEDLGRLVVEIHLHFMKSLALSEAELNATTRPASSETWTESDLRYREAVNYARKTAQEEVFAAAHKTWDSLLARSLVASGADDKILEENSKKITIPDIMGDSEKYWRAQLRVIQAMLDKKLSQLTVSLVRKHLLQINQPRWATQIAWDLSEDRRHCCIFVCQFLTETSSSQNHSIRHSQNNSIRHSESRALSRNSGWSSSSHLRTGRAENR